VSSIGSASFEDAVSLPLFDRHLDVWVANRLEVGIDRVAFVESKLVRCLLRGIVQHLLVLFQVALEKALEFVRVVLVLTVLKESRVGVRLVGVRV